MNVKIKHFLDMQCHVLKYLSILEYNLYHLRITSRIKEGVEKGAGVDCPRCKGWTVRHAEI